MAYLDALWKFLSMSSPYLVLGFFLGGMLQQFIPMSKVKQWLGGDKLSSVIRAALIGVPLPLCSCSVIPTAISLRKNGASKAATSSFLISTPESGVDSIVMTYGLMDLPMAIIRPVAAFFSAFMAGVLQLVWNKEDHAQFSMQDSGSAVFEMTDPQFRPQQTNFIQKIKRGVVYGFSDLINDTALWLAVGILGGALIDMLVPAGFFEALSPTASRLMMLAIGVPLYICASASTPIAVSLIIKGMSPGTALVLLLAGPATSLSNILVMRKFLGNRGVAINIVSIAIVALIFSYFVDWLYLQFFTANFKLVAWHQHSEAGIFTVSASIFMGVMILRGIWKNEVLTRFRPKKSACENKGCCH